MRLDKMLADEGLGSRKDARDLITAGRVSVGGQVQNNPAAQIDAEQWILIDGQSMCLSKSRFYMLNKPAGVVTATRDPRLPTVLRILPRQMQNQNLFPVGRLDRDTEGLLFLTDDGPWCHRVTAPGHKVPKEYQARVTGAVSAGDIQAFAAGLLLSSGQRFQPAELSVLETGETPLVQVVLTEGKYHQVKRMLAARGHTVLSLRRTAVGPVRLDPALRPGQCRPLTKEEIAAF